MRILMSNGHASRGLREVRSRLRALFFSYSLGICSLIVWASVLLFVFHQSRLTRPARFSSSHLPAVAGNQARAAARFCCSLVGVLAGIVARSDIHVGRLLVLPKPIQNVGSGSCLVNLGSGWLMFGRLAWPTCRTCLAK
jgi:hypothetical protein